MGAMKRAQLARTMDAPADLGGAFALRPEVVNCTAYTHTPGYSDWIGAVGPKGPVCPQDAISAVGAKSSVPDPEDAPGATRDALTGESAGPSPPAGPERAACTWEAPARRSRGKAKRAAKGQTFLFGDQDDAERGS